MYAIKPCGTVGLIGSTIESYAIGIGMRWRESNCIVFDRKKSPVFEYHIHNRCVLTKRSIKLLEDLGCSEKKLLSICTPTKSWRAISASGDEIRLSSHFPGCPLGEISYHCTKGSLMHILRSEFLRYGGSVEWSSSVSKVITSSEKKVQIETTYGTSTELEAVICTASSLINKEVLPKCQKNQFKITCGIIKHNSSLFDRLFRGSCDVSIIIGNRITAHCWLMPNGELSFRVIKSPEMDDPNSDSELITELLASSSQSESWVTNIPQSFTQCDNSGSMCFLGDGLLPVDAFEFRGDNAHVMIQEASALCKELYGLKYHRGNLSHIFPQFCKTALTKRKELFQRDCNDFNSFSNGLLEVTDSSMKKKLEQIE